MSDVAFSNRRKAYSYLRFSTPEQMRGDSFRRQTAMTLEYVNRHGLDLDKSLDFSDLGVSAYRGKNAEAGKLADFLEAVRAGLVPQGSFLLVEALDRISRLKPMKALNVLTSIINEGVTVVTLNDGRSYSEDTIDNDPTALLVAVVMFMRANDESANKSRRLAESWKAKRARLGDTPMTSIAPAWLKLDRDAQAFAVLADRADIVRRIFQMALDGEGQHAIAAALNKDGVAPWGRAKHWQRSYIAKILTNAAVIGTMTPHTLEYDNDNRKQRKPLDAVEGYYPAVVDPDDFRTVQAMLDTAGSSQRGRHTQAPLRNILGGMATCPVCGGTSTLVSKGKENERYLVCARAKAKAGCTYKSVRYNLVEEAIVERLPAMLDDIPAGSKDASLDDRIDSVSAALDDIADRSTVLVENLSLQKSDTLSAELARLERERDGLRAELVDLSERRDLATGPVVAQRVAKVRSALAKPEDREALNRSLKIVFTRAIVNYPNGTVDLEWKQGGVSSVPFMWPDAA